MGQKCCKPAMRVENKGKYLLNLVYKETLQNTQNMNYRQISEYLTKKGYIKTLCDYLSSHLNQISPSVLHCKEKQQQARKFDFKNQLICCCITGQILQKIIGLFKQIKIKYMRKNKRAMNIEGNQEQIPSKVKQNFNEKLTNKKELKKSEKRKHYDKFQQAIEFTEEQITSTTTIETCNQILKQTITSKIATNSIISSNERAIDENYFAILMRVQNILLVLLQNEQSLFKINNRVLKQILEYQIQIAIQDPNKTSEPIIRKLTIRNNEQLFSPSIVHNNLKSPNRLDRQSKEFEIETMNVQRAPLPKFNFEDSDFQKLRVTSLNNYEMLFKKYHSQLVSTNLYKDVVKEHLPLLLDRWAKLMIEKDGGDQLSEISDKIDSIILEFFSGYFSFKESEYLYRELLLIFDKLRFSRSKIQPIEHLVFHSLKNFDLRQSVVSKWFDYLLNYLGIITTAVNFANSASDTFDQKVSTNLQEGNNYFLEMNMQLNLGTQKIDYKYWKNDQNIIGCMDTIQRWIQIKQVNLDDILMFKRTKFFVSILSNLGWGDNKINQKIYSLIYFLIESDIRCQGYLISTSIYLIQRAKIHSNILDQTQWQFFYDEWKNKNSTMRSPNMENELIKQKKIEDREKQSRQDKSRESKANQKQLQLINIQLFLDQVICLASYPFLTSLLCRIPLNSSLGISELHIRKMSLSTPETGQLQNQFVFGRRQSEDIKKSDRQSNLHHSQKDSVRQRYGESKVQDSSDDKYSFAQAKKQIFFSVFQEIIQILFRQIDFQSSRIGHGFQIKLGGLFLVSSFTTMMGIIGKSSAKNKNLQCVFNIVKKTNNLFVKIYNWIKIITENPESYKYKLSSLENEYEFSYNRLQISKQISISRDQFQKSPKNRNHKHAIYSLQNQVHKWIYPALSYILLPTQFEKIFQQELIKNYEAQIESQRLTLLYSKILLNISIKLYFRNLINLVLENYEARRNISENQVLGQEGKRNSFFLKIHEDDENNKICDQSQIKQYKQSSFTLFLPIVQIYELLLDFHEKLKSYKQKRSVTKNLKQESKEKEQNQELKKKEKMKKNQKIVKQEEKKQLEQKLRNNVEQTIERIKKNYTDYKNIIQNSRQTKPYSSSNNYSERRANFEEQLPKYSEEKVLREAEDIINNPDICPIGFYLVDNLTKQTINHRKFEKTGNTIYDEATFSKTQKYLMKELKKTVLIEDVEVRSRCDLFRRKKKEGKTSQTQKKQQNQNLSSLQKTADTKFSHEAGSQTVFSWLNSESIEEGVEKIIQRFEQQYELNSGKALNNGESNKKKLTGFNLWQGDYELEVSDKKSSQVNSNRIEQSSFRDVLSEIRKH